MTDALELCATVLNFFYSFFKNRHITYNTVKVFKFGFNINALIFSSLTETSTSVGFSFKRTIFHNQNVAQCVRFVISLSSGFSWSKETAETTFRVRFLRKLHYF